MKYRTSEDWRIAGVEIGGEVETAKIAHDAVIHSGSRIYGRTTSIGPGSVIGAESPVTIEDCQLGRKVKLKGGYFAGSTFLDAANMGSCAHVRAGTILEEEANGAHAVGLKQTIFLPFVTAGSLINFCDVLMAGGTSRKNHSEIGSSYIHFNYTPHQDKATASLIGDVPNGVFLDKKPVFLGGQGGLIGPARIAFGTVVAAGGICRQDILKDDQLHIPVAPKGGTLVYETGVYRNIDRIVKNNLTYIGNIIALREWYRNVRSRYMKRDAFDIACHLGGISNLDLILAERIKRMGELANKMVYSFQWLEANGGAATIVSIQKRFHDAWPTIEAGISCCDIVQNVRSKEDLISNLRSGEYLESIRSLSPEAREAGRRWLQSIVDGVEQLWS